MEEDTAVAMEEEIAVAVAVTGEEEGEEVVTNPVTSIAEGLYTCT